MQITGMLHGAKLLQFAGFPAAEVLGPDASEAEIKGLIDRHGGVVVKPVFKGGVGRKGKAGLIGIARDLKTALAEKERLYLAELKSGGFACKANGVTFEGLVPAAHEVHFSITDATRFRAPTMTITHQGGEIGRDRLGTAAFTIFLYARMPGCAAEADDHLKRGRDMDTRTPASACSFVS